MSQDRVGWVDRLRELRRPLANRDFRLLWSASVLSSLGSWAARLALGLLVLERTGSPAQTGAIVAVSLAPWIGLGQYLATLGDRFDRRTVLVVCDLARAVLHGSIAVFHLPVAAVFALAFAAGVFDPPFQASSSAMLPRLVGKDLYPNAIRVKAVSGQAASLLGFAAGGGLAAWLSPRGAIGVDALSFVVSALLLSRLPAMVAERRPDRRPSIAAGFRVLRADRWVRHAVLATVLVVAPSAAAEGQVAVYAEDIAFGGAGVAGLLAMMVPIGTILATLALRGTPDDRHLLSRTGLLGVIGGVGGVVCFGAAFGLPLALVCFLFVGVAFAAAVPSNIVAGQRIPDDLRASTMGLFQGMIMTAFVVGTVVGGMAAEAFGVAVALGWASGLAAVAGVWGMAAIPSSASHEEIASQSSGHATGPHP